MTVARTPSSVAVGGQGSVSACIQLGKRWSHEPLRVCVLAEGGTFKYIYLESFGYSMLAFLETSCVLVS